MCDMRAGGGEKWGGVGGVGVFQGEWVGSGWLGVSEGLRREYVFLTYICNEVS